MRNLGSAHKITGYVQELRQLAPGVHGIEAAGWLEAGPLSDDDEGPPELLPSSEDEAGWEVGRRVSELTLANDNLKSRRIK